MVLLADATEWIGAVAAALGVPVAAFALVVAARQLAGQRRAAEGQRRATEGQERATEAQFLLSLDDAFRGHDATHRKSGPGRVDDLGSVGIWQGEAASGPRTAVEWADVEAYMGLFERVNVMIDGGLIESE